ncbi:MAG: hypothetical protein AAGC86_08780 [Pseudomonadota bacterium]
MDWLPTIGVGGLLGIAAGLGVVSWVQSATLGGQMILIFVCSVIGSAVSGLVAALRSLGGGDD